MVDRRGLLVAGGAGLLLPGCGGGDGAAPPPRRREEAQTPTEMQGDVEVLNALLEVELQAVAHYRRLRGNRPLFARLLEHEEEHASRLTTAVRDMGGEPAPGLLPRAPVAPRALELARRIEETQIAVCLDALPKLSDPDLRGLVATIAGTEAEHLAVVRAALGRAPAPAAFVTGRRAL